MSATETTAGLDIGSRSTELVLLRGGEVVSSHRLETTHDIAVRCRELLEAEAYDRLMVTGYGRALAEARFDAPTVTEIKAVARGAVELAPESRTILDVGGQDTKVIRVGDGGRVVRFEMNDRCAAGAGRFLEMIALALGYDMEELGRAAMDGADGLELSSMCAVFAESEVVGLVTRGIARQDIARAVHRSIARRTRSMLERVGWEPPLLLVGGAARGPCLRAMLASEAGEEPIVPEDPQMVAALGAALLAG